MAHLQYMPGDPRLVDQLVYELKSKGIFDQFRKECIADVDTRPAYQNLRQRVESSVATFLARQCWKPDLNKNQLREKLRKHILDGNYLEQGVERIVDQVVNPKVASVFIPQVEDLVYNYLGITRKKSTPVAETSTDKTEDLLPTDLEAVSPGSVKSNDEKQEEMVTDTKEESMDVDQEIKTIKEDSSTAFEADKEKTETLETQMSGVSEMTIESDICIDKSTIPLPDEIKPENIPTPENSPPKIDLDKIELPKEPNECLHLPKNPTEIPLPDEIQKVENDQYFKPITLHSEDDDSSSDSSLIRNMSPLTPVRNFNNENSCDAQQAFENDSDSKTDDKKEPSSFRFAIESKSPENSSDAVKTEKKDTEQVDLSHQFNSQVNINTFNTPLYDDSSNSHILHIDYESDVNSKINLGNKLPETENSEDSKKERKLEDVKSSHKSSHRSRDSHRHSSSQNKRSDSKQSNSRDSSRHDKKSKDDHSKSKTCHKERDRSRDRSEKKESRDSSKYRSSHKSSSHKDSKSHRSSSSNQKHSDDKKSSSSHKDKSDKSSDKTKDKSKDTKSASHRSDKDKDRKGSSKSKHDDKEKKKDKKETDDHYSLSGRGNHNRRSTDRDSNDGSTSSKGSNLPTSSKSSETKKETKGTTSKSDNTSTNDSTSPSDKEHLVTDVVDTKNVPFKPIVRVETHLEVPISAPPRLPFVPDVTLKKPKYAANLQEAKRLMKMRKFLDEEQKRMNQEAALLLEFQANVRPSLSQVYSSIPGPELEFACVTNTVTRSVVENPVHSFHKIASLENINQNIIQENVEKSNIINENSNLIPIENNHEINEREDSQLVGNNEVTNTEGIENIPKKQEQVEHKEVDNCEVTREITKIPEDIDISNLTNIKEKINPIVNEDILEGDDKDKNCEVTKEMIRIHEIELSNNIINETFIADSVNIADNKEIESENGYINDLKNETYEENKPFAKLVEEISEYSKASERMKLSEKSNESVQENNNRIELFEVTIITEELSETEEPENKNNNPEKELYDEISKQYPDENLLHYFAEHEKYNAEIERHQYSNFLSTLIEQKMPLINKMYLINCDSYEESIMKEVSQNFGQYEIINYYKNGHLKLPNNTKNIIKNVNLESEITLPVDNTDFDSPKSRTPVFSPVKSECSFELSSDYDAKLEEMVNKTSRQQVMEIILGSAIDDSPTKMPKIDYCMESNIVSDESPLKRKICEMETPVNNNRCILTPNKMRKMSESDQISSTTEEAEEMSNNNRAPNNTRSKYLGRARRVGLPRPRRSILPNSPLSDKSVENYEHNTPPPAPQTPNGKVKTPTRTKVQRYDTSDLYKPKLHYLSRRNNIS